MGHKADRFIDSICAEALDSAAVNHPYLRAISTGSFPNVTVALQDFAFQYGLYNAAFTRYVSAVVATLRNPVHKKILLINLAEEHGDTQGLELPAAVLSSIDGCPHSVLYQRFQNALGVEANYARSAQQCSAAQSWRQRFLALCKMDEQVGVGAIGIGTELIVSRIYSQILEGLQAHSSLTLTQRVFFDLHSQCDDIHATQMRRIALDLSQDPTSRHRIEYGVHQAIKMRVAFWDQMLARAQNLTVSATPEIASFEKAVAVGH